MDLQADIAKVKELLTKSQDILIVTHGRPTFDSIGSALALSLGLTSIGKKVMVVCPDEMTVELSSFVGVNKIMRTLGKQNLVISLDYVEGSIEKVSYNIDNGKFNLVIEPRENFPTFSPDKVQYTYGLTKIDTIIAIDTTDLGALGALYEGNKELFAGKQLINIDRHAGNNRFGTMNLIDPISSASAELVAYILAAIGAKLTTDIATNLLNALYNATNSFENSNITSTAFELAGSCVRAGAVRFAMPKTTISEPVGESVPAPVQAAPASAVAPAIQPTHQPSPAPAVIEPASKPAKPPEDWLKPKIFKSSGSLA